MIDIESTERQSEEQSAGFLYILFLAINLAPTLQCEIFFAVAGVVPECFDN